MIKTFLIKTLAKLYISTFRYNVKGKEIIDNLTKSKTRVVMPLWHNQLLCIIGNDYGFKVVTMISRSQDGGYFSAVVESLGHTVIRASSSRGASAGTMEMLYGMSKGFHAVMASDGPKGPKYKMKSGSLYLAKKADCIIVPVLADCKRFYRFNSWDNFILPKLFSKIDVTFCEPIRVSASVDKADIERELKEVENKIMELTSVYSKNII